MLGSIGMPELIIIFVIALIIFGPRKLPELGRSLGKSLAEFKRASNELRSTLEEEIRLEEQKAAAATPKAGGAARRRQSRPTTLRSRPHQEGSTRARSWPSFPFPVRRADPRRAPWSRTRRSLPAGRCPFWSISTSSGNASSTRSSPSASGLASAST